VTTERRYFHSKCDEVPLPFDARLAAIMSFSSAVRNLQRSGVSGSRKKTRGERTTVAMPSRIKILIVRQHVQLANTRKGKEVDVPSPAGEARFPIQTINGIGQRAAECA
jgi:hypothetical protein